MLLNKVEQSWKSQSNYCINQDIRAYFFKLTSLHFSGKWVNKKQLLQIRNNMGTLTVPWINHTGPGLGQRTKASCGVLWDLFISTNFDHLYNHFSGTGEAW